MPSFIDAGYGGSMMVVVVVAIVGYLLFDWMRGEK